MALNGKNPTSLPESQLINWGVDSQKAQILGPIKGLTTEQSWLVSRLEEMQNKKFKKLDTGKAPLSHLRYLPKSMAEIAKALHFGAVTKNYGKLNWRNCDDLDRYYSAADRHITAFYNGETVALDSGISHLAHAISNLLFINEIMMDQEDWPSDNKENTNT